MASELRSMFSINLDPQEVKSRTDALCSSGMLVCLPSGELRIAEHALREFENGRKVSKEAEEIVKRKFVAILHEDCRALDSEATWGHFSDLCLLPLVREMGARTYEMLSATKVELDGTTSFPKFLERYPEDIRSALQRAIVRFLDPKDVDIRSYVLLHLNAHFLLEASSLTEDTLHRLGRLAELKPTFIVFIDTNFLFSILGLHDNPANYSATALLDLIPRLPGTVSVKLYVCAPTLDETRRVIDAHRESLRGLRFPPNVSGAIGIGQLSGIAMRFVEECRRSRRSLSADEYFRPYLTSLLRIVREKGVELYNDDLDKLKSEQGVIDDVLQRRDYEQERYGSRAKTYEELMHDVVLWHCAARKRTARVESPVDAKYWVATIDFRLLGFDAFKLKERPEDVPVCVHPAVLMQMLQFWVPRTPQFEEAIVASLRYPFLLYGFDPAAERATIRILESLARFENVGDLSQDTIARVLMDQALRGRLAKENDVEKRVEIVQSVIAEESASARIERDEARSALEEAKRRAEELEAEAAKGARVVTELKEVVDKGQLAAEGLKRELAEEQEARRSLERRLSEVEDARRQELVAREVRQDRIRLGWRWGMCGILAAGAGGLGGAWLLSRGTRATGLGQREFWSVAVAWWTLLVIGWAWWVGRSGASHSAVAKWAPFRKFREVSAWVFYVLGVVVLGALGNAAWDWIKVLRK